jgi:hypothetical protein
MADLADPAITWDNCSNFRQIRSRSTSIRSARPCASEPVGMAETHEPPANAQPWIRNKKLDEKIDARATVEQLAQQEAQATAEAPPEMSQ